MTKRKRTVLFTFFTAIFFIIGPFLIFYASGYVFDFHQKRFVQTGAFYFKVSPKDYTVSLNGKLRKKSTPFLGTAFIKNLPPKQYIVEVKKNNYHPWIKKLDINEGLITESRHITLFPQNVNFSLLYKNIGFLCQKDNHLLIEQRNKNNWAIIDYSLKDKKGETIFESNFLKTNSILKNIKVGSNDLILLILETKDGKRKLLAIDNSSSPPFISEINLPQESNDIEINPSNRSEVLFLNENKLFKYNFQEKTKPSRLIDSLLAYSLLGNKIIWLDENGFVYESDMSGKPISVLNLYPFSINKNKKYMIFTRNNLSKILIQEGNSLYYLGKNRSFKKISDDFKDFKISPDAKKIAIFSNHEIRIFFWEDILDQPQRKEGDLIFLTRFSDGILSLDWLNSDYILFNTDSKVKISEIDNRDRLNIIDIGDYKNSRIYFEKKLNEILLLSENSLFVSNILMK